MTYLPSAAMKLSSIYSLVSTNPVYFRSIMWRVFKWCSGPFVAMVLMGALIFKYYRDKKIKIFYKMSGRNKEIIRCLQGLIKAYSPTFYLPHSMLKVALVADDKLKLLDCYMRQDFKLSDGEEIPLDWFPRNYKRLNPATPIVFFVPGVFGTSYDKYSLKFCQVIYEKLGWRSFVLNRRMFASQMRGSNLVSYNCYSDWREILDHIHLTYPSADVYIAGVSMGALNI